MRTFRPSTAGQLMLIAGLMILVSVPRREYDMTEHLYTCARKLRSATQKEALQLQMTVRFETWPEKGAARDKASDLIESFGDVISHCSYG